MSAMHHEVHKVITSEMQLRTELHDANHRLTHVALYDSLTGLYSRSAFNDSLDAAVAQSRRSGEIIGLLFLDVDHFKAINDGHGHAMGDAVLSEVASRLSPLVRAEDRFARLGGDEFAVLLRNLDCATDAATVAKRRCDQFVQPEMHDSREIPIEVSIGVAVTQHGELSAAQLLQEADTALYRAKREPGTNFVVFDTPLREQLRQAAVIENEFRTALDSGQIVAYLQPEIDFRTRLRRLQNLDQRRRVTLAH
jgi:diguanylate cyclase (GGDEF)-like protein